MGLIFENFNTPLQRLIKENSELKIEVKSLRKAAPQKKIKKDVNKK